METLLTESMGSGFSSSALLLGSFFRKRSSETAGNFRQNGTQLVVNRISRWSFMVRSGARSPRINQGRRDIIEVRDIAGRQCGMAGEKDSSDHRVAQFAGTALNFSRRHQSACMLCGFSVERSDAIVNSIQQSLEALGVYSAPSPNLHNLQSKAYFKDCNRCRPN